MMVNARSSSSGTNVYLIGDSTFNHVGQGIRALLAHGGSPLLPVFFASASSALQQEVHGLSSTLRASFPRFSSVQDLASLARQEALHPALHMALVCIYHLGVFISHCSEPSDMFNPQAHSCLVGLCTGALAAVTVSCSRNALDLVALGPFTVRVAFRAALRACDVAAAIEPRPCSSWAMTVTSMEEGEVRKAVADFCSERDLPLTSRPWLSLVASHCVTICGPPSVLQALEKAKLAGCRVVKHGIHAPYHAPHLFTEDDMAAVMAATTTITDWSRYTARLPVISSATGATKPSQEYRQLLRGAVEDILLNPIVWEDVVSGLAYISRFSNASMLSILAVGSTAAGHLSSRLRERGWETETSELHRPCCRLPPRDGGADPQPSPRPGTAAKPRIAIVGMSGRFPEADDAEVFWDILLRGLDVHKVVPPSRWSAAAHVDPTGLRKNTSRTPYGCWLKEPAAFDPQFFNTTPREAFQIDPASRLALMTAYEAMENAGFVPGATLSTQRHRVGVAYGVTSNDWMEVNSSQDIDTFFIPGGCRAFIPGRINYTFKLSGPSYSVDTACSSSLSAIHMACNSLWQGDADTMIAGGTNILTNPNYTAGLDRGHFLSPTGNCKSFDETADGYCRAEGVCSIILKRLDDAVAENDPILGVILGAYTNHSAGADSITRPLVGAQQQVLSRILNESGVDASEVSYVEMHGTGTRVGDPVEMESVVSVFAPAGRAAGSPSRDVRRKNPLHVGAVKANVGHGEAAAGVTSLAKVLLMMKHQVIPPHAGLRAGLNKSFPEDLDGRNVHIARAPLAWESHGTRRKAVVNNFSAAGGNTALLVEEAPEPRLAVTGGKDPRDTHIVTVSAKSSTSLRRNMESLVAFLGEAPEPGMGATLPSISYTTTARRSHHPFRVAVHGTCLQQVRARLEAALKECLQGGQGPARTAGSPRIVFAFTGNGSQYAGMGHDLYQLSPTFRADLDRLDRLVQQQGFKSVIGFCCGGGASREAGAAGETPCDPVTLQLATVCLELALSRLWISWGVRPSCTVGHSLGEYAALSVAGVISEADAIFLAGRRATLLSQRCQPSTHAMLAVRAPLSVVEPCVAGGAEVACINGPEDIVLAGTAGEISEAMERLRQQGIKAGLLGGIPYAFHSAQVDPILDGLVEACDKVTFHRPSIPVLSPLLGTVVTEAGSFSSDYMRRHCRETVDMHTVLTNAHSSGLLSGSRGAVLEIGPSPLICSMVLNTLGSGVTALASLRKDHSSWAVMAESLSALYSLGCDVDWMEYHSGFPMSYTVVQLPSYGWDLKEYWIQHTKGDPVPEADTCSLPQLPGSTTRQVLHGSESLDGGTCEIVVETDLSSDDIRPLAQGHRVDGVALITPSLYAGIALHIGQYIVDRYQPLLAGRVVSVDDMTVESALVAHGGPEPQLLRSTVLFDAQDRSATCRFETADPAAQEGEGLRRHSHCRVRFRERSPALEALSRGSGTPAGLARTRVEELCRAVGTGGAYRFSRNMMYKMVGSLAHFSAEYRRVDELVLSSAAMEACSRVSLHGLTPGGRPPGFHTDPAAIDALSQSAGFIMNGNDAADLDAEVFVNHGWGSFQLFEPISAHKVYVTHCAMREGPRRSWEGDCLVLDGDVVVAWFGAIIQQGVPRRVLSYMLGQQQPSTRSLSQPALAAGTTHALPMSSGAHESPPHETMPEGHSELETPSTAAWSGPHHTGHARQLLRIFSHETGIPEAELSPEDQLADLGVDSLLMLQLASRLGEEMRLDISTAELGRLQSVGDLCSLVGLTALPMPGPRGDAVPAVPAGGDATASTASTREPTLCEASTSATEVGPLPPPPRASRAASSVILQGKPRMDPHTLFLFPDGSGSATSYLGMGPVRSGLAVVGLNCPYIRHPDEMEHATLDALMGSYLHEIRRRQPWGPYRLGGWSAGGILAFRAAQMLIQEGEQVESLVLIDSPPPTGLDALPDRWYEHCTEAGIFGEGHRPGSPLPPTLIPHFRAQIRILGDYVAEPLPAGFTPRTSILWAGECVFDGRRAGRPVFQPRPEDPEGTRFLTQRRVDESAGAWGPLFPLDEPCVTVMRGEDHFSMMEPRNGKLLAGFVSDAVV